MTEYSIKALVYKIQGNSVFLKGITGYTFENSDKKRWNILEGIQPKLFPIEQEVKISTINEICKLLFSLSMVQHCAFKFVLNQEDTSNSDESPFTLKSIEQIDAQKEHAND